MSNTIPDDVMRAARAIMTARDNGGCEVKDWSAEARDNPHVAQALRQARAVIEALNPPSSRSSSTETTPDELAPSQASSGTHSDWITWNGGECPVDPETQVEWRGRDGNAGVDNAGNLDWGHWADMGNVPCARMSAEDIIAYRIVPANLTQHEASL